jgi:hypothetical protein
MVVLAGASAFRSGSARSGGDAGIAAVPSWLAARLAVPGVVMPVGRSRVLADLWRDAARSSGLEEPIFLLGAERDASSLRECVPEARLAVDRAEYRGPAGALVDMMQSSGHTADCDSVLICDGSVVPSDHACAALLAARDGLGAGPAGAVLADEAGEYCGLMLLDGALLSGVSDLGFVDLKEQFLPSLKGRGARIARVTLPRPAQTLRTLANYLAYLRTAGSGPVIEHGAVLDPSACVAGCCVVCSDARIGPGSVVIDSVVMRGAEIVAGAVVARSVVGPGSIVSRSRLVSDDIVTRMPSQEFQS